MTYETLRSRLMEIRREIAIPIPKAQVERVIDDADEALKIGRAVLLSRNAEVGHIAASMSDIENAIFNLGMVEYAEAQSRLGVYENIMSMRERMFEEAVH